EVATNTWARRIRPETTDRGTFVVDLIDTAWPTNRQGDVEARVVQTFYPASAAEPRPDGNTPEFKLRSPAFILKESAIQSFAKRFPRAYRGAAAKPVEVADIKITFAPDASRRSLTLPHE